MYTVFEEEFDFDVKNSQIASPEAKKLEERTQNGFIFSARFIMHIH